MTTWVLIIYIGSEMWLPMQSYPTEDACYEALAQWEFQPGTRGTCLPGVIEKEEAKKKKGHRR